MNRTIFLSVVTGGMLAASLSLAQTLLGQAERTAPPASGALPSGELTPATGLPRGGYLGFVPDERYTGRGVRIESVKAGAPAAQGGLKDGDLITAVDGRAIANLAQFDDLLDATNPGQKLQMTVDRGGRSQQLTVTLGTRSGTAPPASDQTSPEPGLSRPTTSRPWSSPPSSGSFSAPSTGSTAAPALTSPTNPGVTDAAPSLTSPAATEPLPGPGAITPPAASETTPRSIQAQPLEIGPPPGTSADDDAGSRSAAAAPSGAMSGRASLGISVDRVTDEARREAGAPSLRGALIASVKRGSPAEQAGLPLNGVIVRLDSREITSGDDVVSAIKAAQPGQEVEVTYFDRGRLFRKVVRLAGAGGGTEGLSGESSRGNPIAAPPAGGTVGEGLMRGAPGALGNRPILRNLGQMAADTIGRPGALSTVYDPSVVAALQTRVAELTEQTRQLEERIRQLESKLGGAAGTATPATSSPALTPPGIAPPAGPSFGAPSGPGFGPALGGTGTTP